MKDLVRLFTWFRFRQCIVDVIRSTLHPCIWRLAYFQTPRPILVILHELCLDQAMIQFICFFHFFVNPFNNKKGGRTVYLSVSFISKPVCALTVSWIDKLIPFCWYLRIFDFLLNCFSVFSVGSQNGRKLQICY